MSPVVGRAPLVVSLALAGPTRLAARTGREEAGTPQAGRLVTVAAGDGALLADTERGPVLLIIAWDATIHGPEGPLGLDTLTVGDHLEWTDDGGQAIVMVHALRAVPVGAR